MAGSLIGALRVTLGLDSAEFSKGVDSATRQMGASQKKFAAFGSSMVGLGSKMSLAITAPLIALAGQSSKAATESAQALGQVEAALKSMGPVAGRTSDQLQTAAEKLQSISTFDDDDILRKVTANMLTFGNVAGTQFDRAQAAVVDLSARMGTDLQSAALMVGKALNDPAKGINALKRVGIQFTEQQKEQVQAMAAVGDTAGAQAIMLSELERQFGGSAKAMRAATPGADTAEAWRNFQETVGKLVNQILPPLTKILTGVLNAFNSLSPGMQSAAVAGVAILAALGPVITVAGGLVTAFGALLPVFAALVPIIGAVGTALFALLGNPIVLAAAAVIGGIYLAWKNWDKITAIVAAVGAAVSEFWNAKVMPVFRAMRDAVVGAAQWWWDMQVRSVQALAALYTGVKTWLLDKLGAAFKWVQDKITAVGDAFYNLYERVVGHSYVPDMINGVIGEFARLNSGMVQPAIGATDQVGEAFKLQADDVDEANQRLAESFKSMVDSALSSLRGLVDSIKKGDILGIVEGVLGAIGSIGNLISGGKGFNLGPLKFPGTGGGASVPGLASGGSMRFGGFGGVDRNLLSMNGTPLARVSRGETMHITPANDRASPAVVRVMVGANEYFDARVERVSGNVVAQAAPGIAQAGSRVAMGQMQRQNDRRLA